jgi:glycosyltransferase involved in cell wall biosynthesis
VRGLALRGHDLVISLSHCVAKAVRVPPGALHLCYCFTPMRYAWSFHEDYFAGSRLKRALAAPVLAALRKWDRATAANVDLFVAISAHVRDRIHRFYGRDAEIVHPPADTDFFTPGLPGHDGYDLIVSALVPYKRVDIALDAYTRLGTPLKIVGVGTEADRLRARAGANVEFLGWKSDPEVRELYRRCRRLVFPGEEDFGIVPVEAMACGKPVVALARGGVTETVTDGISGLFFAEQTPAALAAAVEEAGRRTWDPAAIRAQALRFGVDAFIAGMERCIRKCLDGDQR